MPNIKSAIKRVARNDKRANINRSEKSEVKTAMKKLNAAIDAGDVAAAEANYKVVCSILDKAVSKGLYHKNNAANKKSGFAVRINALKAAK